MKLLDYEIANYKVPIYVAELSCNHKGQLNELLKQIEIANYYGADIVKIQCYEPDSLTWDNGYVIQSGAWQGRNLYELYKYTQTPYEWIKPIFEFANSKNIPLFSSVYDLKGLQVLEDANCPAYKIASFEAHNPYFVKKVCLTGKPVIISTGMMNNETINNSITPVRNDHEKNICLLHCVSRYPTDLSEAALGRIESLRWKFQPIPVGYSDHTNSIHAAISATALGAAMIEKHFSGVYQMSDTEDGAFSLDPVQFRKMVELCNKMHAGSDNMVYRPEETEIKSSLHIVKEIKKGEIITEEYIKSLRPNLGLSPDQLQIVIGKKAKIDIFPGTPLISEYIENA